MRKVPKLRFKEFSDEWEENKLEELTTYVDYRGKTPKKVERGILLVTAKNIKMGYIDYNISKEYVAKENYDEIMRRGKVKKGEVLLTTEAPLGNVAQIDDENIALAQRVIKFAGISLKIDNSFLKYRFITEKFQTELKNKAIGTTVLGIQGKVLHKLLIKYPLLQEQEKIANFLSSVDKKISLTEEKLELFREYKKGVMQKIFSQELRFKDSNGNDYPEWEEKKLGEIAFFSKGKLISKEDITEEGVECIRYGELYTIYKEKIEKVVSKTKLEKNKLILSEKNDVIIPSSGETAIDIAVASCVMKDGVALGADLNIIKTKENGLYLAYFINNPAKLELASLAQGASVIHLYEKHLKLLNIKIPTLEEQEKIADFLSSIDSKIESIEKELEGLKEFKKGLLQQMFI